MIESPALASQTAERFEAMSEPQNSYVLALQSHQVDGARQLTWQTREDGNMVDYWREPTRRGWHRLLIKLLSWLPIEGEL